jgi:hypothetical protein
MTPESHEVARETLSLRGPIAVASADNRYGPDIYIHASADAMAHGSS